MPLAESPDTVPQKVSDFWEPPIKFLFLALEDPIFDRRASLLKSSIKIPNLLGSDPI
jgi:hypothetical protein